MLATLVFQLPSTATMNLDTGCIMITNHRENVVSENKKKHTKEGTPKEGIYNLFINITLFSYVINVAVWSENKISENRRWK